MVHRNPDPYGVPRPAPGAKHVPLRTSIWIHFRLRDAASTDRVLADSVRVLLQDEHGGEQPLVEPGQRFVPPASGWFATSPLRPQELMLYIEPGRSLSPDTRYTIRVQARSADGLELTSRWRRWQFRTEAAPMSHEYRFAVNLSAPPVRWHGGFFTGICNVVFCTTEQEFGPLYRAIRQVRQQHPRAWRTRRDIWLTFNDEWRPDWAVFMNPRWPNIVRERETRRVVELVQLDEALVVRVEDVFGCEQYGVPPDRPLAADYQPGYEVIVADRDHAVRTRVLGVDEQRRLVRLEPVELPKGGFRIEYSAPPPEQEDPDAPGRFAGGGTYLRRLRPPGTPVYFWQRLDAEYDKACRLGQRIIVNFVGAPPDLAIGGENEPRPKDYVQWHEVVRTIAGHLIDRYREQALSFKWSVYNEPDLHPYWRRNWEETQRFYDYTVDAVLRAFEDRGYDSSRVLVGGWELGAIFGTHLRLREILAHCSPQAEAAGALEENAAYADKRLDGKRSRRVERLCREHAGRGSPCDFLSIHAYNRSWLAAAKFIRAKQMALEADSKFFRDLAIDSNETCPNWNPPPDPAAVDSYSGNGYFASWCYDVAHHMLLQAARDARYGFGEYALTIWPPPVGFSGINTLYRRIPVDLDGDGRQDEQVAVPEQVFHAVTLLSDFGPDFWPLPAAGAEGHRVGGFVSGDVHGTLRVALVTHHAEDTQSRSERTFRIVVQLRGLAAERVYRAVEYRFDRLHNTTLQLARQHRPLPGRIRTVFPAELARAVRDAAQLQGRGAEKLTTDRAGRLLLRPEPLVGNAVSVWVLTPEPASVEAER